MNVKLANLSISVLFIGFGVWLIVMSNQLHDPGFSQISSGYYPRILAVILIILSVIMIVKTLISQNDKKIEIPNIGRIVGTIIILALFLSTWYFFGYFYIQAFLYMFIMFTLYRLPLGVNIKRIAVNFIVALVIVFLIYIIFDVLIYVQF